MKETKGDVMATVDAVLVGKEIKEQPRAFLLLKLCQLSMLLSPDRTEHYWKQLAPLKNKLPKELQTEFENLGSIIDETSRSGAKGFAAEIIADVEEAKKFAASDIEEAKQRLRDCWERLKKRHWPMGKTPAKIALVEAWVGIDRHYALRLIDMLPSNVRESLIQRINRVKPLTAEEWMVVTDTASMKQAVQIALKILDDEKAQLLLPKKLLLEVGARIRDSMRLVMTPPNEAKLGQALTKYSKLVMFHKGSEQNETIPTLLEEMLVFIAEAQNLDQSWAVRFTLMARILELGVYSNAMTPEMLERLLERIPSYLVNFVRAHYAAVNASPSEVEDVYSALLSKAGQNPEMEAWFLVNLVSRDLGAKAMALAEKSDRRDELLPRLRRAWLSTHPESSKGVISSDDMAGDAIGEFLAQVTVQDRVAYLRKATDGGTQSLPRAMWYAPTLNDIATGRLPLYSSYQRNTKKEEQFREQLRISGYGEYNYQTVDNALLGALVVWGEEDAAQVRSLLHTMWNVTQPSDEVLMVDWLRNTILTRCRNVLAADPEILVEEFLDWFNRELVKRGRSWQSGNMRYTLRIPDIVLMQFCLGSAMVISPLSPSRRDQILLSGMAAFRSEPPIVEAAAQLYNSDKDVLDLAPPFKLKQKLLEAWQLGVVKNAIPFIAQAMVKQASS